MGFSRQAYWSGLPFPPPGYIHIMYLYNMYMQYMHIICVLYIHIKKQRHYFANKGPSGQGYGFSSGHVWMWELDCEESRALKNCCFWTVVLEKTLESPLDCKEIQPVHRKGDQSWVFIGRTDAEAETPILWPPQVKRPWFLEGLGAGGEGDDRGWDGWMASLTWWTWVWVNSRSWWWTGRTGVLQFMWSHSRTRLSNWTELICIKELYWYYQRYSII